MINLTQINSNPPRFAGLKIEKTMPFRAFFTKPYKSLSKAFSTAFSVSHFLQKQKRT